MKNKLSLLFIPVKHMTATVDLCGVYQIRKRSSFQPQTVVVVFCKDKGKRPELSVREAIDNIPGMDKNAATNIKNMFDDKNNRMVPSDDLLKQVKADIASRKLSTDWYVNLPAAIYVECR